MSDVYSHSSDVTSIRIEEILDEEAVDVDENKVISRENDTEKTLPVRSEWFQTYKPAPLPPREDVPQAERSDYPALDSARKKQKVIDPPTLPTNSLNRGQQRAISKALVAHGNVFDEPKKKFGRPGKIDFEKQVKIASSHLRQVIAAESIYTAESQRVHENLLQNSNDQHGPHPKIGDRERASIDGQDTNEFSGAAAQRASAGAMRISGNRVSYQIDEGIARNSQARSSLDTQELHVSGNHISTGSLPLDSVRHEPDMKKRMTYAQWDGAVGDLIDMSKVALNDSNIPFQFPSEPHADLEVASINDRPAVSCALTELSAIDFRELVEELPDLEQKYLSQDVEKAALNKPPHMLLPPISPSRNSNSTPNSSPEVNVPDNYAQSVDNQIKKEVSAQSNASSSSDAIMKPNRPRGRPKRKQFENYARFMKYTISNSGLSIKK